jgi:hypothetical protein
MKSNSEILKKANEISNIVFKIPHPMEDLLTLRDTLLTYICHNASLPCIYRESKQYCIKLEHVSSLINYTDLIINQHINNTNKIKHGILRAYGLLHNIVSHVLEIISENKTKFVLYSGHYKSLEYLTIALGISYNKTMISHFASRIIIEVYKNSHCNMNHKTSNYYFRVLVNGKDLTKYISFCKAVVFESIEYESSKNYSKYFSELCPIESIIRYLHDNYFNVFNSTNFKDACLTF